MFETITWLVTNRCALGCKYCNFKDRKVREASVEDKIEALKVFKEWKDSDKRFICLLGGDIACMEGQDKFLNELNSLDLSYGYQTSGIIMNNMRQVLPYLKNLSISVDPVSEKDWSRFAKALLGIYWAGRLQGIRPEADIHATITVDRENVRYVPMTAKILSQMGIWVEITMVHWKKSGFDLVPEKKVAKGFEKGDVPLLKSMVQDLLGLKRMHAKIHSTESFLKVIPKYAVDLDWKCPKPVNCVVDVDLSMRCCLHLPGKRVRRWKIFDLKTPESWYKFYQDWMKDQSELCPGCFWDCQLEVAGDANQEEVDKWFQHGR